MKDSQRKAVFANQQLHRQKLAYTGKPHHEEQLHQTNHYGENVSNLWLSHLDKKTAQSILRNTALNERKRGNKVTVPQKNKTEVAVVKPAFWDKRGGFDGHDIEVQDKKGNIKYQMGTSKQINGKYTVHTWRKEGKKHG